MKTIIQNINKAFDHRIRLGIVSIVFILLLNSCGGEWTNDYETWEKTFFEEKPNDIIVKNSYYWKSSHWTYEYIVYIEAEYNQKWLMQIIKEYDFKIYQKSDAFSFCCLNNLPKWFKPKANENYISLKSNKYEESRIFIDLETNTIFFTINQL